MNGEDDYFKEIKINIRLKKSEWIWLVDHSNFSLSHLIRKSIKEYRDKITEEPSTTVILPNGDMISISYPHPDPKVKKIQDEVIEDIKFGLIQSKSWVKKNLENRK
jgi:hypothetical protein